MAEDSKKKHQERKHYRIRYPVAERARFECQGKKYEVLDVSEQGLAFRIDANDPIRQSKIPLHGRILFRAGDAATVAGKILRYNEDSLILLLHIGVPYSVIMTEQRYLLKKYGHLDQ